ncbi:MAG TPA: ABC transporter permease [Candidatus Nanopelagicaceae bacterium]
MRQHNLGTVLRFEFIRTVNKRRFWVGILAVPLLIAVVFALVFFSGSSSNKSTQQQQNARFSFQYFDASGLVDPVIIKNLGGQISPSVDAGVAAVKAGRFEAFFSYPANPGTTEVKVYGIDNGIFANGKYASVAQAILKSSVEKKIGSPILTLISQGTVKTVTTTYKNGKITGGLNELIPAALFLVIFYLIIILLGNQMLTSTLDEKENRVTEMILTTINPTNLILGKIISLMALGLVQIIVFAIPFAFGYVFFRSHLHLPNINLSNLVFDPQRMTIGALLLLGGFALFTGTLVALGAAMPTAKDAGPIFGGLVLLMVIPFYIIPLIMSDSTAPVVQIFSYFPYSAPVTAMLRNALGTLPLWQAIIIIVELFVLSAFVLRMAVRLFRYGSIEYSRKLSLREIFSRRNTGPLGSNPKSPLS